MLTISSFQRNLKSLNSFILHMLLVYYKERNWNLKTLIQPLFCLFNMFMWCLLGANIDRSDTMLPGSQNRPNVLLHHVAYKNLWKFFFKDFLFIFQCVSINGFVHSSPCLWKPRVVTGFPGVGAASSCDCLTWVLETELSPLNMRQMFSTAEPSLLPPASETLEVTNWQSSLGDISRKILEKMFWEKWGWLR